MQFYPVHTFIIADNISLNLRVLDITAPLPKPGTSDSKRQVLMSAVFSPATNAKTQESQGCKNHACTSFGIDVLPGSEPFQHYRQVRLPYIFTAVWSR